MVTEKAHLLWSFNTCLSVGIGIGLIGSPDSTKRKKSWWSNQKCFQVKFNSLEENFVLSIFLLHRNGMVLVDFCGTCYVKTHTHKKSCGHDSKRLNGPFIPRVQEMAAKETNGKFKNIYIKIQRFFWGVRSTNPP